MAESGVIESYLTVLSAQLPQSIVEELADGLDRTCQRYLDQGLEPPAAADAALAEFGDPAVILADFTRLSPARHAARRLLATGPVVGGCWGIALITSRAWAWPVPTIARLLLGVALLLTIGALATAACGQRYRSVGRAAAAGCAGITAVDAALVITVPLVIPAMTFAPTVAMAASLARITVAARGLLLARAR
jgi:hypothetical protein